MSSPLKRPSSNWAEDEINDLIFESPNANTNLCVQSNGVPSTCQILVVGRKDDTDSEVTTITQRAHKEVNNAIFPSSVCEDHVHYFSPDPNDWDDDAPLAADFIISRNYTNPIPAYPEMSFEEDCYVDWTRARYAANWRDLKVRLGRDMTRPAQYKLSLLSSVDRCDYGAEDILVDPAFEFEIRAMQDNDADSISPSIDMEDVDGENDVEDAAYILFEEDSETEDLDTESVSGELEDNESDASYIEFDDTDSDSDDEYIDLETMLTLLKANHDHQHTQHKTDIIARRIDSVIDESEYQDISDNDEDVPELLHSIFTESPHHQTANQPLPSQKLTKHPEPWDLELSYHIAAEFCRLYDAALTSGSNTWIATSPPLLSTELQGLSVLSPRASTFIDIPSPVTRDAVSAGWFRIEIVRWRQRARASIQKARKAVKNMTMVWVGKCKR